jgi:DNA-binding NtrC family response regulator
MSKEGAHRSGDAESDPSDSETLKLEVLKVISRALESKVDNPKAILDFDPRNGVDFYKEVTKFEIELIKQALACTKGNQRAAARLLGLKTTTLNSKVKTYNLDVSSKNSESSECLDERSKTHRQTDRRTR